MTEPDMDAFAALLQSGRDRLYMLIDSAHDHQFVPWLRGQGLDVQSLFSGIRETTLAEVAPYLAPLPEQPSEIRALIQSHWGSGKCWSIVIQSTAAIEQIRVHLKKSLMAELDDGTQGYFRFYDARVLERFITTCTLLQMEHLFGDCISRFYFAPATLGEASLMALRRTPRTGWRVWANKNTYQLTALERQGNRYAENIR